MTSTIEDEKRKKKRSLDGRPRRAKFLSAGDCYLFTAAERVPGKGIKSQSATGFVPAQRMKTEMFTGERNRNTSHRTGENRDAEQNARGLFFKKKKKKRPDRRQKWQKNLDHFSICACHPCAGAMLIFSVSFQFYRMSPKGQPYSPPFYI